MRIVFEFDTANHAKDMVSLHRIFEALIGEPAVNPTRVNKAHTATAAPVVATHEAENVAAHVEPETADASKSKPVTLDDMKALLSQAIKHPSLGGPKGVAEILKKYGADCLLGQNQLKEENYSAVHQEISSILAS